MIEAWIEERRGGKRREKGRRKKRMEWGGDDEFLLVLLRGGAAGGCLLSASTRNRCLFRQSFTSPPFSPVQFQFQHSSPLLYVHPDRPPRS
jgi:hypothetical protein